MANQKNITNHLEGIGFDKGFFESLGSQHSALYVKGSEENGRNLIVTFENLDDVDKDKEDRMPWGYGFVSGQGWSMLGMMAHDWTWYRDQAVYDFFDRLEDDGFFDEFDSVIFYGASMGAYAAAAFSSCCPNSTVVLLSPQATLSRDITSWETRYRKAWKRNFTNKYGYAPDECKSAKQVFLFYDPLSPLDAMHAALFQGENITKFKCRFMGHRIASLWQRMGILKDVILGCFDNSLTHHTFYSLLRARLHNPRYQKEMLNRLEQKGRPHLIWRYTTAVLNTRRGPVFRKALNKAAAEIEAKGGSVPK